MPTLTVTAQGQVTLPKDVLRHMNVHPGDKITVDKLPGGRIEARTVVRKKKISDLFGSLRPENGRSLTMEDMTRVASDAWSGKR